MDIAHLIHQKPKEKILYTLHRHPLTFLPIFFLFLILLCVPFILYFVTQVGGIFVLENKAVSAIFILLTSGYFLGILLLFYTQFIEFYLDVWIITDDRVVDIEQWSLFSRTISELDLFRIQDVTADVHGILPTIFNYGSVTVKTASDKIDVILADVPNPNHIREALIQLSDEDRKKHNVTVTNEG